MTTKTAATLAAAVAVAMLAGCGDSARPDPATPEAPAAKSSGRVSITDFKFVADRLSVKVGATVTFTNVDRAPHTATAERGFDTGVLRQGQSKAVTIEGKFFRLRLRVAPVYEGDDRRPLSGGRPHEGGARPAAGALGGRCDRVRP